ncbi:hypothetical protein CL653_02465 [bacterium]|nr:hypothetical protein [bacterium]
MEYLISFALIACSALFSGLTLGYFTLDVQNLRRQAKLGDLRSKKILPIREKGNQLLTTLLLGNVAVNAILSVFLSSIASGIVAATTSTVLIFLFGEIIPQAVISRYAVSFGSKLAPIVRLLMFVSFPITFPIAYLLDKLLGDEIPSVYSHREIMELISEHEDSEHSAIDEDEERIIHGALQFSHRTVREVMTPAEKVTMFDENRLLDSNFFTEVNQHGFSRYPVYSGNPTNISGILYAKDLIVEDEMIAIKNTDEAFETDFLTLRADENLDNVLAKMLKKKRHIGIVLNRKKVFIGVITLEDIIEEIIQLEIEDEED